MTRFVRNRAVACPDEGLSRPEGCWNENNRGGQVKRRNVRPVGWGQNNNETSSLANIARQHRTLPFPPTRRFSSAFRTLRARP